MRKSVTFWGAFLLGGALILVVLLFGGRMPEVRTPGAAIPWPEESSPYVYYEGKGKGFPSDFAETLTKRNDTAARFLGRVRPFLDILRFSDETAFLLKWENNVVNLSVAATYPRSVLKSLERGEIPESWQSIKGIALQKKDAGKGTVLTGPSPVFPLHIAVDGGILLMASSEEPIAMMVAMLQGNRSAAVAWSLESSWENHIRIFDGGLFAQLAAIEKIPVSMGTLGIDVAWTKSAKEGRLRLRAEGLAGLLPASLREALRPVSWGDRPYAVEPFIASFGVNLPGYAVQRMGDLKLKDLSNIVGSTQPEMQAFLPGPVVGSLAGKSKFLVFTLPGLLFQFPGRGDMGKTVVESFWKNDLNSFVPKVTPLEGFTVGGTATIPFSILGAAAEDMVALGIIDRESLKRRTPLSSYMPVLKKNDSALFWLYLDAPRLGEAVQSISGIARSVEKIGETVGMDVREFDETAMFLKGLGKITFVMTSVEEGLLEWTVPHQGKREPPSF